MQQLRMLGAAIPITLAIVAATGGLFALTYNGFTAYTATLPVSIMPTAEEIEFLIRKSGVTPESLAAAGVLAGTIGSAVTDASDYIIPNFTAIKAAEDSLTQLKRSNTRLLRLVRSGTATNQQRTQLGTVRTELAAAQTTFDAYLDAIYQEIAGNFTPAQTLTLARLKGNQSWSHPIQYKAADRSESDWVVLRNALSSVRISNKLGEIPNAESQLIVQRASSHPAVVSARVALNNLPFIQTQWDNTLSP